MLTSAWPWVFSCEWLLDFLFSTCTSQQREEQRSCTRIFGRYSCRVDQFFSWALQMSSISICKSKEQALCFIKERWQVFWISLIPNSSVLLLNWDCCCVCLSIQDYPVSKTSQIQGSHAEGHRCFWTDNGLSLCEQWGTLLLIAMGEF